MVKNIIKFSLTIIDQSNQIQPNIKTNDFPFHYGDFPSR